jgi:hypothetical protein
MTPQEIKELAGITGKSASEINKEWADKQITQPTPIPATPMDHLNARLMGLKNANDFSTAPTVENIADRLNSLMRKPGQPPKQEQKPEEKKDTELENLSNRLNIMMAGIGGVKVERLN